MAYEQFITWLFYGVLGGSVAYGVMILGRLRDSVDLLNQQVAVVIQRTEYHEKSLDKLDERITRVEEKV